jgi:hypothetical protein
MLIVPPTCDSHPRGSIAHFTSHKSLSMRGGKLSGLDCRYQKPSRSTFLIHNSSRFFRQADSTQTTSSFKLSRTSQDQEFFVSTLFPRHFPRENFSSCSHRRSQRSDFSSIHRKSAQKNYFFAGTRADRRERKKNNHSTRISKVK